LAVSAQVMTPPPRPRLRSASLEAPPRGRFDVCYKKQIGAAKARLKIQDKNFRKLTKNPRLPAKMPLH